MEHQALTTEHPASRSLAVATTRLNGAINDYVVTLAKANGSTTTPAARFIHFNNATARAIGLPKSDAKVINALPIEDRAVLAVIRAGVAARIPQWAAQVETEGGTKSHNRILTLAKQWADMEVKALRACGIEDVISHAEALLALEDAA